MQRIRARLLIGRSLPRKARLSQDAVSGPRFPPPACTRNRVYPVSGPYRVGRSRKHPTSTERSTEAKRGRVRGTLRESNSSKKPLTPPSPRKRGEGGHASSVWKK